MMIRISAEIQQRNISKKIYLAIFFLGAITGITLILFLSYYVGIKVCESGIQDTFNPCYTKKKMFKYNEVSVESVVGTGIIVIFLSLVYLAVSFSMSALYVYLYLTYVYSYTVKYDKKKYDSLSKLYDVESVSVLDGDIREPIINDQEFVLVKKVAEQKIIILIIISYIIAHLIAYYWSIIFGILFYISFPLVSDLMISVLSIIISVIYKYYKAEELKN